MKVNYQLRHPNAARPTRATDGSGAFDLTAAEVVHDDDKALWIDTHLALEIPRGFIGLVFARSSVTKKPLSLANAVGLIDSDYRGTIQVRFRKHGDCYGGNRYYPGDRVAQLLIIPLPDIDFEPADELSESGRGERGFGSTGS